VLPKPWSQKVIIEDPRLSKNELVRTLRSDVPILAMPDGTSENLNLMLVSTTFARVFKEVDGVVSRGMDQRRRFSTPGFSSPRTFSTSPPAKTAPSPFCTNRAMRR
jgi:hypothetical protein